MADIAEIAKDLGEAEAILRSVTIGPQSDVTDIRGDVRGRVDPNDLRRLRALLGQPKLRDTIPKAEMAIMELGRELEEAQHQRRLVEHDLLVLATAVERVIDHADIAAVDREELEDLLRRVSRPLRQFAEG